MIRLLVVLLAMLRGAAPQGVADAPTIEHVAVERLRPGEDLVVEAIVSGPRPIARVSVSFQVDGRFADAALERTGPSAWRARMPAARLGRGVVDIIHASDEGGRVTTWPSVTSGAPGHRATVTDSARAERHLLYVTVPAVRNYIEYGGMGVLVFDVTKGHR